MHMCFLKFITGFPRAGRPRPLLGCPGLRLPSFPPSLEWATHSGWSLGHTLHCSHPKPPSRGRWEQERQDQPRRKNSFLLRLSFQKIQCVRLHLTDKWHGVGNKTGVLLPLNSHPIYPSAKHRGKASFKGRVGLCPQRSREAKTYHEAKHLLKNPLSSKRNAAPQAGPSPKSSRSISLQKPMSSWKRY